MGETPGDETPWALVVRLREGGADFAAVVEALRGRGLERDDIELLLGNSPEMQAWKRATEPPPLETDPSRAREDPFLSTGPGSLLRWVAVFTLLGASLVAGWAWTQGFTVALAALAGVAAALAGLLVAEFRFSPRRTAATAGPMLFVVYLLPAVFGALGDALPLAVVSAALTLAGLGLLVWSRMVGEPLPGVGAHVPGAPVFESNDVQFVALTPANRKYAPGEAVDIVLVAQCCVDGPRELVVTFEGSVSDLGAVRRHAFPLSPGVIVELTVPVRLGALVGDVVHFTFDVAGRGAGGKRVRVAEGGTWVTPRRQLVENVAGLALLVLAGHGEFTFGSNGNVRVTCDPNLPMVHAVPEPRTRVLHTPTAELLERAARA